MHVIALCGLSLLCSAAAAAPAEPPVHLCAGKPAASSDQPLVMVESGQLTQLLERKLKPPVAYRSGSHRNIELLPAKNSLYQFAYPGELSISEQADGKRIVHNHHVTTDGRYLPNVNGWWVIEIAPSGTGTAIGFNQSFCYFRLVYQPAGTASR